MQLPQGYRFIPLPSPIPPFLPPSLSLSLAGLPRDLAAAAPAASPFHLRVTFAFGIHDYAILPRRRARALKVNVALLLLREPLRCLTLMHVIPERDRAAGLDARARIKCAQNRPIAINIAATAVTVGDGGERGTRAFGRSVRQVAVIPVFISVIRRRAPAARGRVSRLIARFERVIKCARARAVHFPSSPDPRVAKSTNQACRSGGNKSERCAISGGDRDVAARASGIRQHSRRRIRNRVIE